MADRGSTIAPKPPAQVSGVLSGQRVLLVDDDAGIATLVAGALTDAGAAVELARSADAAIAQASRRPPSAMVIHLPLPRDAAAALGRRVRGHDALGAIRLIILSGEDAVDEAAVAVADVVQPRPISIQRIVNSLDDLKQGA